MSNLPTYGYGKGTEYLGVSGYGYGQGTPVGLVASLDLITTLQATLDDLQEPVEGLDASLALTTSLTGELQFIPIGQLASSLGLETSLSSSLDQPIASVEELLAPLDLTTAFSGALQFITIPGLESSLGLTTSLEAGLESITLSELLSSLHLAFAHSVELDQPTASLEELEADLGLTVSGITAFLVPKKILRDQRGLLRAIGPAYPIPEGYYLKAGAYLGQTYRDYIYFPVLSIEFEPDEVARAQINKRLVVVFPPQEITYEPKKPGGATLWRP